METWNLSYIRKSPTEELPIFNPTYVYLYVVMSAPSVATPLNLEIWELVYAGLLKLPIFFTSAYVYLYVVMFAPSVATPINIEIWELVYAGLMELPIFSVFRKTYFKGTFIGGVTDMQAEKWP